VQPLFNTDIWYNTRIRQEISSATEKQYKASARILIYDIRNAYFSYMKAAELHNWLMEAKALSTEFVRVNESLLANDKVTADAFYRARAEDSRVDQEIAEAERLKAVSMGYFNYLTGRPADDPVTVDDSVTVTPPFGTVDDVIASALAGREELVQLDILRDAAAYGVKLYSAGRLPTLAAAADYGFQGEQYRFTGSDDYMLASRGFKMGPV
jgi:outer membrane protein TolC